MCCRSSALAKSSLLANLDMFSLWRAHGFLSVTCLIILTNFGTFLLRRVADNLGIDQSMVLVVAIAPSVCAALIGMCIVRVTEVEDTAVVPVHRYLAILTLGYALLSSVLLLPAAMPGDGVRGIWSVTRSCLGLSGIALSLRYLAGPEAAWMGPLFVGWGVTAIAGARRTGPWAWLLQSDGTKWSWWVAAAFVSMGMALALRQDRRGQSALRG